MKRQRTVKTKTRFEGDSLLGINFLAGLWLVLLPFILGFSNERVEFWNELITGVVLVLSGASAIMFAKRSFRPRLFAAIAGGWLIFSPFLLGYDSSVAIFNEVVVGMFTIAIVLLSRRKIDVGIRDHYRKTHPRDITEKEDRAA